MTTIYFSKSPCFVLSSTLNRNNLTTTPFGIKGDDEDFQHTKQLKSYETPSRAKLNFYFMLPHLIGGRYKASKTSEGYFIRRVFSGNKKCGTSFF